MKNRTLLLLAIGVIFSTIGLSFFRWMIPVPEPRLTRLLYHPPDQIELKSPLWGYRDKAELVWATTDLSTGLRKYSWSGFLEIDPEIPDLRISVGEKTLPEINHPEPEDSGEVGFAFSLERRSSVAMETEAVRRGIPVHSTVNIPSRSSIIDFESKHNARGDRLSPLELAAEGIHLATFPVVSRDWSPFRTATQSIAPGIHQLTFRIGGPFRIGELVLFVRNLTVREPMRIDVLLPHDSPPPEVEFRPANPVECIQRDLREIAPSENEPVKAPWETYDEDNRWVRSVDIHGLVRTGVFLPTPATWIVGATAEAGSTLVMYPAVVNTVSPETSSRARLRVFLDQGSSRSLLLDRVIGPKEVKPSVVPEYPLFTSHSWQVRAAKRGEEQPDWDKGVRISLPAMENEGARLVFEATALESGSPPRPVILGDPLILPPSRLRRSSGLLTTNDILNWDELVSSLIDASKARTATPPRRVWLLLDWRARLAIGGIGQNEEIAEATKTLIVSGLNQILGRSDFYAETYFSSAELSEEIQRSLQDRSGQSSPDDSVRYNRSLLQAGFPGMIVDYKKYEPQSANRPNIILISIDTLRADALSCFGYFRKTSPWMDYFFGGKGVLFLNVEAPSSWTLPSHSSLFLSQFVSRHGVWDSGQAVPANAETATELLARAGYETAAFVDRGLLHYRYGFHQGFFRFDQKGGGLEGILPRCLDWLETRDRTSPLFLFLHTYDVHTPYAPPPQYRDRFLDQHMKPSSPGFAVPDHRAFNLANIGVIELKKEDAEYCRALYDAQILYVDSCLRDFFGAIERKRLLHDPLIVVVSDHGEGFGEHGLFDHGWTVYQELTRVPVLMKFPKNRFAGTKVDRRVSLIDVFPTVVDHMGKRAPEDWQGISLLPLLAGEDCDTDRRIFSEIQVRSALYDQNLKHIHNHDAPETPRGEPLDPIEVYNLSDDPMEGKNLVHELPGDPTAEIERMTQALGLMADQRKSEGGSEEVDFNPEMVEELKALGYLK